MQYIIGVPGWFSPFITINAFLFFVFFLFFKIFHLFEIHPVIRRE
jgi:hypothetical protein